MAHDIARPSPSGPAPAGDEPSASLPAERDLDRLAALVGELCARERLDPSAAAATLAHSLGNPIACIAGVAQIAEHAFEESDPRRSWMREIQAQVGRVSSICRALLRFGGRRDPARTTLDLAAVAAACASASAGVEARGHGIALGDGALVLDVMNELVGNARDAGATRIVLQSEAHRFLVYDDGPGLAPDVLAHVFEPFFTTKHDGLGLGLATARRMMRAMGGDLVPCASPLGGAGFAAAMVEVPAQSPDDTA